MGRRRSSGSSGRPPVEYVRDASDAAFHDLVIREALRSDLRELEDRRRFHPEGRRTMPAAVVRSARRLVARFDPSRPEYLPHELGFYMPRAVAVCIRRKQRKEVLHAKGRVGKGSGGGSRRRSWLSDVVCR